MIRYILKLGKIPWIIALLLVLSSPVSQATGRDSPARPLSENPVEVTATIDQIRYIKHDSCSKGQVLIEEIFTVGGFDPVDLLIVRKDQFEQVSRHPVEKTDKQGRIIHSYCAGSFYNDFIETSFLSYNGLSTNSTKHAIWVQGQKFTKNKTPTLRLDQSTGYTQFANKKNPLKGNCCWHYAYIKYNWHKSDAKGVSIIEMPLTIRKRAVADSHVYLMYYSAINNVKFYLGYQTNLKQRGKDFGPGVIFSRWDTQNPAALKSVVGGFSEIGDYEGRFVSVRKPLQLQEGPVSFEMLTQPDKNNSTHIWLDLFVVHTKDGQQKREKVGSLRFPGSQAKLTKKLKITVESYSLKKGNRANLWMVPAFDYKFYAPKINSRTIDQKPEISYPEKAPKIVKATRENDGVHLFRTGLTNIFE